MKKYIIILLVIIILIALMFGIYNNTRKQSLNTENLDIFNQNAIENNQIENTQNKESKNNMSKDLKTSDTVIISCDVSNFNEEQKAVLNNYLEFQQAMIDKNISKLDELTTDDKTFTHMSGKVQTKKEYFDEIKDGTLNYYKSELLNVNIDVQEDTATMTGRTTLTAKVYGASGAWTLSSGGYFVKINGLWYQTNK